MRLVRIIVGWLLSPRQLLALAGLCGGCGLLWAYAAVQENANRDARPPPGSARPPRGRGLPPRREPRPRGRGRPARRGRSVAAARPHHARHGRPPARRAALPASRGGGGAGRHPSSACAGRDRPAAEALADMVADGVVEVTRTHRRCGRLPLILAGALAVEGRWVGDRFVAVQPYVEGREAALQPVADPSRPWLWPIGLGVVFALFAGWRRFLPGLRLRPRPAPRAARASASARPAASAHFAPLPLQEEVAEREGPDGCRQAACRGGRGAPGGGGGGAACGARDRGACPAALGRGRGNQKFTVTPGRRSAFTRSRSSCRAATFEMFI
jgi:hypothetical protein